MINRIIKFFPEQKLVTVLVLLAIAGWGLVTAPFDWNVSFLPRDPVPVDAIPDIGENQQIVFILVPPCLVFGENRSTYNKDERYTE